MTLQAIQQAVSAVFGHMAVQGFAPSLSYGLVLIGIAMLIGIVVVGGAALIVRGFRALGNMTPGRFVAFLLGLAVALIVVGALVP